MTQTLGFVKFEFGKTTLHAVYFVNLNYIADNTGLIIIKNLLSLLTQNKNRMAVIAIITDNFYEI